MIRQRMDDRREPAKPVIHFKKVEKLRADLTRSGGWVSCFSRAYGENVGVPEGENRISLSSLRFGKPTDNPNKVRGIQVFKS